MIKITAIKKESPWYNDREHFIGEEFQIIEGTGRFVPMSDKAKKFAQSEGVEFFVFVNGAEYMPT